MDASRSRFELCSGACRSLKISCTRTYISSILLPYQGLTSEVWKHAGLGGDAGVKVHVSIVQAQELWSCIYLCAVFQSEVKRLSPFTSDSCLWIY